MERCNLCPLSHYDRSSYSVTTCIKPILNIDYRNKLYCQLYSPKIQPIKAVRFKQPSNSRQGYGEWTNLIYRPIIQGAVRYRGVYKLVPLDPPPCSPILCRPAPDKPTDSTGMVVYCRGPSLQKYM